MFIIPGIVKYLEYQRAVYVKLNDRGIQDEEAYEDAKIQMKGRKGVLFFTRFLVSIILAIIFSIIKYSLNFDPLSTGDLMFTIFNTFVTVSTIVLIEAHFNIILDEELGEDDYINYYQF